MSRAFGASLVLSVLFGLGASTPACTGDDPALIVGNGSENDAASEAGAGGDDGASPGNDAEGADGGETEPPATGEVVFSKTLVAENILVNDIAFDGSGNVFVGGAYKGASSVDFGDGKGLPSSTSVYDGFVAKFDTTGACLWVVAIGGASDGNRIVMKVGATTNGGVVFGASTRSSDVTVGGLVAKGWGDEDITLGQLDASGAAQWLRSHASAGPESLAGMAVDALGRIAITGSYTRKTSTDVAFDGVVANPPVHDMPIGFVAVLDASGKTQTLKAFPVPAGDPLSSQIYPRDVVFSSDGVVVAGKFAGKIELRHGETGRSQIVPSAGADDGFVVKVDASNTTAWATTVGNTGIDSVQSLAIDPRNGDVKIAFAYNAGTTFAGVQLPTPAGFGDLAIGRYDANGLMLKAIAYGSSEVDVPTKLVIDRWGNTIIVGAMMGSIDFGKVATAYGVTDGFVAKISPDNVGLWAYGIGGSGAQDGVASAAVATNGNVGVVGAMAGEGNPKILFGKTINIAPGTNAAFVVVTKP